MKTKWYVYENHLHGNAYVTSHKKTFKESRCDQCGDSDRVIETFASKNDADDFAKEHNGE